MEIGSFIEFDFVQKGEYFESKEIIARLNSGRSAIYYAIKEYGLNRVFLPYYMCPSVSKFLLNKGINVEFYNIDTNFKPIIDFNDHNSAFVFANYFGLFSTNQLIDLTSPYKNVIIDNSQAFFTGPIISDNHLNVYSPRKFFGVPDGGYVIGKNKNNIQLDLQQDFSSKTSSFLFERIEYGLVDSYKSRMLNEERIDASDILLMSRLTKTILNSIDYESVISIRKDNFLNALILFEGLNEFDINKYIQLNSIPMVYPLLISNENLIEVLKNNNVYTGRWWAHVLRNSNTNDFEKSLSRFMLPIAIDQRYDVSHLKFIKSLII